MNIAKKLIRFQDDLLSIHIPFTTTHIFDTGIPDRSELELSSTDAKPMLDYGGKRMLPSAEQASAKRQRNRKPPAMTSAFADVIEGQI